MLGESWNLKRKYVATMANGRGMGPLMLSEVLWHFFSLERVLAIYKNLKASPTKPQINEITVIIELI